MPRAMTPSPSRRVELPVPARAVDGPFTVWRSPVVGPRGPSPLAGRGLPDSPGRRLPTFSRTGDGTRTGTRPQPLGVGSRLLALGAAAEAEPGQDAVARDVARLGVGDDGQPGRLERADHGAEDVGHEAAAAGLLDEPVADLDDAVGGRPEAADGAD